MTNGHSSRESDEVRHQKSLTELLEDHFEPQIEALGLMLEEHLEPPIDDTGGAMCSHLVHPTQVPALLPPSPQTGRSFTSASVYRWLSIGRLTTARCGGTMYALRPEVVALAVEIAAEAVPA